MSLSSLVNWVGQSWHHSSTSSCTNEDPNSTDPPDRNKPQTNSKRKWPISLAFIKSSIIGRGEPGTRAGTNKDHEKPEDGDHGKVDPSQASAKRRMEPDLEEDDHNNDDENGHSADQAFDPLGVSVSLNPQEENSKKAKDVNTTKFVDLLVVQANFGTLLESQSQGRTHTTTSSACESLLIRNNELQLTSHAQQRTQDEGQRQDYHQDPDEATQELKVEKKSTPKDKGSSVPFQPLREYVQTSSLDSSSTSNHYPPSSRQSDSPSNPSLDREPIDETDLRNRDLQYSKPKSVSELILRTSSGIHSGSRPKVRRFYSQQQSSYSFEGSQFSGYSSNSFSNTDLTPLVENEAQHQLVRQRKFNFDPPKVPIDWNDYKLFKEQMNRRRSTGSHIIRVVPRFRPKHLR